MEKKWKTPPAVKYKRSENQYSRAIFFGNIPIEKVRKIKKNQKCKRIEKQFSLLMGCVTIGGI